jgi:hypothetical protein
VDRHLLPDEIDSLLDGEVGFGTAPLKMHVRRCVQCAAELDGARALVRTLEHLPHLSPSPLFRERVMARVQVFVPWHAALLDTLRGWLPRSRPARAVVGGGLTITALALTALALWVGTRLDTVIFAGELLLDRGRALLSDALGAVAAVAFGEPALRALRSGSPFSIIVAMLLLVAAAAAGARVLRALVVHRHRG